MRQVVLHIRIGFCLLLFSTFVGKISAQNDRPDMRPEVEKEIVDSLERLPVAGEEYILGLYPTKAPQKARGFTVGGFYRFFATYTRMTSDPYLLAPNAFTPEKTLFIGDDSQLPNLYLTMGGRPSRNSSFSVDLFAFQFLNGELGEIYGNTVADSLRPNIFNPIAGTRLAQTLGLNLGINLNGSISTDHGSFAIRMGGTHWYQMSDLTFASFRGFNRFTLFETNPWDPVEQNPGDRMNKYYKEGAISQDLRWGNRPFHGVIIEGTDLPARLSFSLLYRKTEFNGGYNVLPNQSFGGRLKKEMGEESFVSFNTFNSITFSDSLAVDKVGFNVMTLETSQTFKNNIGVHVEAGIGRYFAPDRETNIGEVISAKLQLPKTLTYLPFELHYYRISPNAINNNALFWNTSITEFQENTQTATQGSTNVLTPTTSSVIGIGQMTNNRTGVNLNTELEIKKFKFAAGIGMSSEIEALSNSIAYGHPVNQLTRSRLWRWNFPQEVGPYSRYSVAFRDVFETLNLTNDVNGVPAETKKFSTVELQAKYKVNLGTKPLYLFYLGRYNSVQPKLSPIPVFSEKAYLRQYVSEWEAYLGVTKNLVWSHYIGIERTLGNYNTEVDFDSRRPRNQKGFGYGTGLEYGMGKNAVLRMQYRWFSFEDRSFANDQFKGREALIELKTVF